VDPLAVTFDPDSKALSLVAKGRVPRGTRGIEFVADDTSPTLPRFDLAGWMPEPLAHGGDAVPSSRIQGLFVEVRPPVVRVRDARGVRPIPVRDIGARGEPPPPPRREQRAPRDRRRAGQGQRTPPRRIPQAPRDGRAQLVRGQRSIFSDRPRHAGRASAEEATGATKTRSRAACAPKSCAEVVASGLARKARTSPTQGGTATARATPGPLTEGDET
jgi:hypothetical protein